MAGVAAEPAVPVRPAADGRRLEALAVDDDLAGVARVHQYVPSAAAAAEVVGQPGDLGRHGDDLSVVV
jgi:hypothetical protein